MSKKKEKKNERDMKNNKEKGENREIRTKSSRKRKG